MNLNAIINLTVTWYTYMNVQMGLVTLDSGRRRSDVYHISLHLIYEICLSAGLRLSSNRLDI
jgi:hypothetical protein